MQARHLASFLTIGAVLAGCDKPPVVVLAPPPPPLPPHLGPPPSGLCSVAPFKVADGGTVTVSMTIGSDGGYCAARLTDDAGTAFAAGLVPQKPAHGENSVVKYNGKTSVEYFVTHPGFVGHDSFVVKLITAKSQPGYTTLNVSVDVQPAASAPKSS